MTGSFCWRCGLVVKTTSKIRGAYLVSTKIGAISISFAGVGGVCTGVGVEFIRSLYKMLIYSK
jgi:ABC-type spermidine/putrescine transport system permease subunit II